MYKFLFFRKLGEGNNKKNGKDILRKTCKVYN